MPGQIERTSLLLRPSFACSIKVCLDEVRARALLGLLTHLVKDKCFNQLRTKEQLG